MWHEWNAAKSLADLAINDFTRKYTFRLFRKRERETESSTQYWWWASIWTELVAAKPIGVHARNGLYQIVTFACTPYQWRCKYNESIDVRWNAAKQQRNTNGREQYDIALHCCNKRRNNIIRNKVKLKITKIAWVLVVHEEHMAMDASMNREDTVSFQQQQYVYGTEQDNRKVEHKDQNKKKWFRNNSVVACSLCKTFQGTLKRCHNITIRTFFLSLTQWLLLMVHRRDIS